MDLGSRITSTSPYGPFWPGVLYELIHYLAEERFPHCNINSIKISSKRCLTHYTILGGFRKFYQEEEEKLKLERCKVYECFCQGLMQNQLFPSFCLSDSLAWYSSSTACKALFVMSIPTNDVVHNKDWSTICINDLLLIKRMTQEMSIVHLARLDRTTRVKEWCHSNDILVTIDI